MLHINHKRLFLILSVTLLFLTLLVNYLDRHVIAFAIAPIQHEFHINNVQFGAIAGAFGIGYMLMALVGGILVDRFKAHKVLAISACLWSIVSILTGFADGFFMLFAFRILLGFAESPAFPSNLQVASSWLPITSRARTLAIGLAAVPLASAIGAPLISHLIITFNWRITYFILGAIGIILSVLWFMIYRDNKTPVLNHHPDAPKTTWRFMLCNPTLLVNNYAFFVLCYLLFFAQVWLPGYLEQVYDVKLRSVGFFLIAPWLLATVTVLCGGILSDKLLAKTGSLRLSRTHIIWVCQLVSALCFIPIVLFHSLLVAIIFITLGVGIGLAPNALFDSINIDLSKDRAATSLSLMNGIGALAGIIAPWFTGWLVQATGNFKVAFGFVILLALSSVLAMIFFHQPDKYK
jgi:ACS family hexuronate transporter-like MFS transporter